MAGWHEDFMDCPEPEELGYDDWNDDEQDDWNEPYTDSFYEEEEYWDDDEDDDYPDYSDWE